MTKIKFCGLRSAADIDIANRLNPEYIGFVFVKGRRRYIPHGEAAKLRKLLNPGITAVGVFINEEPDTVARLLVSGVIDAAQLHGDEDDAYIREVKKLSGREIIKAFIIAGEEDAARAENSAADYVLLDAGAGCGKTFPWEIAKKVKREFFLAGGLNAGNAAEAVRMLRPYAVDVSGGIERDGKKDFTLAGNFISAVRGADRER